MGPVPEEERDAIPEGLGGEGHEELRDRSLQGWRVRGAVPVRQRRCRGGGGGAGTVWERVGAGVGPCPSPAAAAPLPPPPRAATVTSAGGRAGRRRGGAVYRPLSQSNTSATPSPVADWLP